MKDQAATINAWLLWLALLQLALQVLNIAMVL